ncbi:flavodoxin family protein [candidate division KSB1 bacterium]|nr:flavodoxin family protein [candidate division KSB1 bacterium]
MRILAFQGSPRPNGNSTLLLNEFIRGARDQGADISTIVAHAVNIKPCRGCLKCNMLKRCAIHNDDWPALSEQILEADCLLFATPVYFHHMPGPLKTILDRFRSFMHVQITEIGLRHTPWHMWQKHFVAIMTLGSSSADDTTSLMDLFQFMVKEFGPGNTFSSVIGTRLAVPKHVIFSHNDLQQLYPKLNLSQSLALDDYQRNQQLLNRCYELGRTAASFS